jgi:hypothetical protein
MCKKKKSAQNGKNGGKKRGNPPTKFFVFHLQKVLKASIAEERSLRSKCTPMMTMMSFTS